MVGKAIIFILLLLAIAALGISSFMAGYEKGLNEAIKIIDEVMKDQEKE